MIVRSLIIAVLLLGPISFATAQENNRQNSLSEYLEQLAVLGFDEYDIADISEEIDDLLSNPVRINSKSRKELERLFFLTSFQVQSLLNYTYSKGALLSAFEIRYITGFDRDLAILIQDYITFDTNNSSGRSYPRTQLISSIIYSTRDTLDYPGSKIKAITRIKHEKGRLAFRLTYEKDKGETWLYNKYVPEFLSGGIELKGSGQTPDIIFGDYRVRFGQGLTVWHGYSPGNSPLNPNPIRGSSRIIPYASSDENNYFRGLAATGNRDILSYNIYLSANRIDASTDFTADSNMYIKTLYDSGLHNTSSGLNKRNTLTEYSAGLNLNANFKRYNLGVSVTGTHFNSPLSPTESTETKYDFRGSGNLVFALDHAVSLNKIYLYGESAINSEGSFASIQGLRIYPVERAKINILWSHLSKSYISFHGHVSGKETVNNFRNNLMANLNLDLAPGLSLSAGVLKSNELWFGYRSASFPSSTKYLAELIYNAGEISTLKLSAWQKDKKEDLAVETGPEQSELKINRAGRLHLVFYPMAAVKLISRIEVSSYPSGGEHGMLAYQGFSYKPASYPFGFTIRFYAFSTSSYNTRIYAYEDDLLYSPSIPSFYGKGKRAYLVLDYKPKGCLSLRLKFGFSDKVNDEIPISYYEYRFQLRLSL